MPELSENDVPNPSVLISYYYEDDPEIYREFNDRGVNLLTDSGAYTAYTLDEEIGLNEYADFCREVGPYVDGYFNLDAIGDIGESARNHEELKRAGLSPIPVWQSHDPQFEGLSDFIRGENWVALGGLVTAKMNFNTSTNYNEKRITSFIRRVRRFNSDCRVHLLGYENKEWLKKLQPYSADSSGLLYHYRWGNTIPFFDPLRRKWTQFDFHSEGKMTGQQVEAARYLVGCPVAQSDEGFRSRSIKDNEFGDFSWAKAVAYAIYFQRFLRFEKKFGTRLYVVASGGGTFDAIRWLLENGNYGF